ncbi:hypothetical protein LDENG_00267970 [Lucifuga dentata]|nr:hypothetical protein LDENG_00267970 [Lucifuga dentata]
MEISGGVHRDTGYGSRYRELEKAIKRAFPDAVVTGEVGRSHSFEVTVNGQLIHSKLQTNQFPEAQMVVARIQQM